jgi:hypothetical protein
VKHKTARLLATATATDIKTEKHMTKQLGNLIGLGLLLAAVSASAQTTNLVRVRVPFPFVSAGRSWPAADYNLQIRTENSTVTLSSPGIAPAIMITRADQRPEDGRNYLQFQRAGDHWILREVTLDGTAHVLPKGELEKELADELLSVEAQP